MSEVHPSDTAAQSAGEPEDKEVEEETVLKDAGVELCLDLLQPSANQQAPVELLAEFLRCVLSEEYAAAQILCNKVVELEPSNEIAKEFLPVLQERLTLDEEMETESSSTSGEEEDEEEDEEENEETSSDDESDEEEEKPLKHCEHHLHS